MDSPAGLAPYLAPWVEELKRLVSEYPALAEDSLDIRLDTESESPMADGAALLLVASFLNNTLEGHYFFSCNRWCCFFCSVMISFQ